MSTHAAKTKKTPTDIYFALWFAFITVGLVYIAILQSDNEAQQLRLDVTKETNSLVEKIEIITQIGLRSNRFFTQAYQTELERLINQEPASVGFWQSIERNFNLYQGVFIYSSHAELLFKKTLHATFLQHRQLEKALLSQQDQGIVARSFNGSIYYYVYSRFYVNQQAYYFVIKHQFNDVLINSMDKLPGIITLVLVNNQYTLPSNIDLSKKQGAFTPIMQQKISPLNWEIVVYWHKDYPLQLLLHYLKICTYILCALLLVYFIMRALIKRQQRKYRELRRLKDQINLQGKQMMDSIDEIVINTSSEGVINYLNTKATHFLGAQQPQELLGRFLHLVYPDPQAIWNQEPFIQQMKDVDYLQDKQQFYEQSYQLITTVDDKPNYLWVLRDVTERKHNLDLLEKSNSRYQSIFSGSGSAHILIKLTPESGLPLVILDANDAALNMFALQSFADITHNAEKLLEKNQALRVYLQQAKTYDDEFEIQITALDNQEKFAWAHIHHNDLDTNHLLLTLIDITERNQLLKNSTERERFWKRVMEAIPDLVYVAELGENDFLKQVIYKNITLESLLDQDESESSYNSWLNYLYSQDLLVFQQNISELRQLKEKQQHQTTLRFLDENKKLRHIRFKSSRFEADAKGKTKSIIGLARDVTDSINSQQKIINSEKHYRLVTDNISDVIWSTDTELNITFISSSVENMFARKAEEITHKKLKALLPSNIRTRLTRRLTQQLNVAIDTGAQHSKPLIQDIRVPTASGNDILVELHTSVLFEQDKLIGLLGVCRDVTKVRKSEQQLKLSAKVFESSNDAIVITDNRLKILRCNRSFTAITGYQSHQVIGKDIQFLISPENHHIDFIEGVNATLKQMDAWQGEVFYNCSKGNRRIGWVGVNAVNDEVTNSQSLIMVISDITERKAIEERIHHLAYYDSLTGLPNRTQLHERLSQILATAKESNNNVVLLFIDLDRFKPINDSMGHPAGDLVLKQVSERLRDCTKRQDLVSRIGGDEFTVIIENQGERETAKESAIKISERILGNLNKPYFINNRELFLGASIGIALYPSDGLSVTELIKNSDLAMYHAKHNGRGNIQFFSESMNKLAVDALELENDLRPALANQEFELYYQPQYSAKDCKMTAIEALIRWNHPQKGLTFPGIFIATLEETGMIIEIGQWVLEQACRQFVQWQQDSRFNLEHVSVNVSARQFKQKDFIQQIQNVLLKTNIKPRNLEIELTESVLVDDVENTFITLSALRELGIKIAIDDFGTGYSSLNYLKRFPFDTLKIDQSFVQELPENQDDAQITRAIIALAKNMKVSVVAEGVETKEQLNFLSDENCNKIQGYLFERPLPADELFAKFLHEH